MAVHNGGISRGTSVLEDIFDVPATDPGWLTYCPYLDCDRALGVGSQSQAGSLEVKKVDSSCRPPEIGQDETAF